MVMADGYTNKWMYEPYRFAGLNGYNFYIKGIACLLSEVIDRISDESVVEC